MHMAGNGASMRAWPTAVPVSLPPVHTQSPGPADVSPSPTKAMPVRRCSSSCTPHHWLSLCRPIGRLSSMSRRKTALSEGHRRKSLRDASFPGCSRVARTSEAMIPAGVSGGCREDLLREPNPPSSAVGLSIVSRPPPGGCSLYAGHQGDRGSLPRGDVDGSQDSQ